MPAVYVGEGYVVEATLRGVRYAPIYPYLGGHRLRVRRPLHLSDDDRWRIAIQAGVRSNERYAMQCRASCGYSNFRLKVSGKSKADSPSQMPNPSFALSFTRMPTVE